MKKITQIILLLSLCCIPSWGQKKYEMVVEKTDGTETVFNVEDISRTYFRERENGDENDQTPPGVEVVDLGLPSGVKWANVNIGATKPEEMGKVYSWNQCDAAIATWGDKWELPTKEDFSELMSQCTKQNTRVNGTWGWKFTGPNGNSIFLPGDYVGYWSSTLSAVNQSKVVVLYESFKEVAFTNWEPTRNENVYVRLVIGHKESDPVPGPSDNINIQQLFGKWVCYYQQWTFDGEKRENNYTTDDYYINLGTDYTGVICSQEDELFEWGTGGYVRSFNWSVSGENIRYLSENESIGFWEIVSQSEDYLTLRWVGGTNGNYIIVARFVRNHIDTPGDETQQPQPGDGDKQTFTVNGVTFNMIAVEGGTFQMGSSDSDADSNESPVHSVTLSSFCIGETEVTQALWYAVMGQKPTSDGYQWSSTYGLGDNRPAYYVSWNDCQEFITKLNQLTGKQFRLPTEAEWEFAARGGNKSNGYKYAGSNTIEDVAWYWNNSSGTTHDVATKQANELGIYDMSGNVWEWCSDWSGSYSSTAQTNPTGATTGSGRVGRGGSWYYSAWDCRVSRRFSNSPTYRFYSIGLRLAL